MAAEREFDLVVYGSTGFTGNLVACYLARNAPAELRWAVAGRDAVKLHVTARNAIAETVRAGSSAQAPGVVVADAACTEAVAAMARCTRVILSTAGPFRQHGTAIIAACVQECTDYVDINGEVAWHQQMIEQHGAAARRAGVRLLMSAGFDSAPSDLGALWMAERARDELSAPLLRCASFVTMRGQLSGGTVLSGILSDESEAAAAAARRPYALGGGGSGRQGEAEVADQSSARFEPLIGAWTAPFGMARINTRIVRRSVGLLEETCPADAPRLFAPGFVFSECALAPNEEVRERLPSARSAPLPFFLCLPSRRSAPPRLSFCFVPLQAARKAARAAAAPPSVLRGLIQRGKLPKPGAGPSLQERAKSWFCFHLVGEAAPATPGGPPRRIEGTVKGGDPGYDETAKMVAEAALILVADRRASAGNLGKLAGASDAASVLRGGFTTPAVCLGARLRRRLQSQGIRFEIVKQGPQHEARELVSKL